MSKLETIARLALAAAVLIVVPAMHAGEKRDLDPKRLATLAEQAETAADFGNLAELYEQRAAMLEDKAARHDQLEQRYAAAPRSLIAKRGHGWNTPARQRQLSAAARKDAQAARELARTNMARADSLATDVD